MDWFGRAVPPMRREAHYGDRVLTCFAERPGSLFGLMEGAVAANPDGEALICGGERLTWRELDGLVARVAAGLAARGVRPGDRVALLVGNRVAFPVLVFAAARLGAISVPLSTRLQTPEIAYALDHCGAQVLVHEAELAERLPAVTTARIVVGGEAAGAEGYEALARTADHVPPATVAEEDTAVILYTSGTTGRPKGAMLTHLSIVHSALVYRTCMDLTPADRSIAAVPLAHVTGLIANIAAMTACAGALVILPAFKAADFLATAARERITATILVPAMYNLCLLQPDFEAHDLSAWRIGGYGGAPMPKPTIERLAATVPSLQLMNAYGATETTSPTTLMPPRFTPTHGDSVGQPAPGATVIVVDEEGREVTPSETGEIWIHGASVVRGYWNNPEATSEAIVGGFWRSGDVGSIDREGFVRVLDRKKDMINRGGHKIYTAEVETVLAGHPAVIESAVVAAPCPVLGERVHAFVVLREQASAEALRAYCAERVSDYKVPETITLRPDPLPRNANGKVMKRVLREELAATLEAARSPTAA